MSTPAPAATAGARSAAPRLIPLFVFAVAMGWLEAVVVVYIRGLLGIAHAAIMPPQEEVLRGFVALPWLLATEQSREVATILILASAAWMAGRRLRSRLGSFLVVFGVWDIVYYVGLYVMVRWPPSLMAIDVLFLIPPGPWWSQPVWVPIAISALMIAAGLWMLRRNAV